jgi:methyl-accepting chemotaxis protein
MLLKMRQFFSQFTLTQKLAGGFAFLAIVTVLLGGIGYFELVRANAKLSQMSEQTLKAVGAMRKIAHGQNLLSLGDQGLLIYRMKGKLRDTQYEMISEGTQSSNGALQDLQKINLPPEVDDKYKAFLPLWEELLKLHASYIEISKNKDLVMASGASYDSAEARQFDDEMLESMLELRQKSADVRTSLSMLVNASETEAFATVKNASGENAAGRRILLIASLLVGAFSILFGQLIARSIVVQLRKAAELASSGELTARLKVHGTDELAQLSAAFNRLSGRLLLKTEEAMAIAKGNLAIKIDVDGERDELGKSFRDMASQLTALVTESKGQLGAITKFVETLKQDSDELGDGATRQAAAVEEIGSSIAEVSNQAEHNAKISQDASALMSSTSQIAKEGTEHIRTNVEAISNIADANKEIVKVIKVIDDIAFQTNLLALNASVEAARAGVHGKGFSVVASEVRNLAGRSAKAAKETEDLLSQASQRVENGVSIAQKTAESFANIVQGVERVAERLQEIAKTSREQSTGVQQVSEGLRSIGDVAQKTASKSTEIAHMCTSLESSAAAMELSLNKFRT